MAKICLKCFIWENSGMQIYNTSVTLCYKMAPDSPWNSCNLWALTMDKASSEISEGSVGKVPESAEAKGGTLCSVVITRFSVDRYGRCRISPDLLRRITYIIL